MLRQQNHHSFSGLLISMNNVFQDNWEEVWKLSMMLLEYESNVIWQS